MITVYVGNLPNETSAEHAQHLLAAYGAIKSIRLTSGESESLYQGFCFAEMEDQAARAAIADLDGTVFEGAILCVYEATPVQLAYQNESADFDGTTRTRDDAVPSNVLRRYFQVVAVDPVDAPGGGAADDWCRYELASGGSLITGFHRGSIAEVTEYATNCAANFNLRNTKGAGAAAAARSRKK